MVTLGLVLDTPVATVPDALAAAVGVTLLVGDAVVGTVRADADPTADLVTTPGTDPDEVRRRNVRADVLVAWMLPGFAVVGVVVAARPRRSCSTCSPDGRRPGSLHRWTRHDR